MALGFLLEGSGMIETGERAAPLSQHEGLELKQLQKCVRLLLDNLPEREQQVIGHHYLHDMPFQEIAELCGLSKGRISQIHRRALAMLRHAIASIKSCDIAW